MIIITGASGGLGKELFFELSKENKVIGIFNKQNLESKYNGIAVKLNLLDHSEIEKFVENYKSKLTNITLIQLAVGSIDGLLANYSFKNIRKTFELNLFSNIRFVQELLPYMISQKWGRIINFSSIVSNDGAIGAGIYASSKSALLGYNKTLSKEYGRFGITSNILELGYFESGLIETFNENQIKDIISKTSRKRLGKKSDLLSAIKFIQECDFYNGEVLKINGGR